MLLLEQAAELLRKGELVAFPTETVYGLGANALDAAAVRRIYEAKGRPETSPLIVHVASVEMARELVEEWPAEAETLAARYWPGPLTLVLPKRDHVPDIVTAGLRTVGVRMPAHALALELIRAAGIPLAAPSANRFSELSPTRAEHVRLPGVAMVLDGGPCAVGIESTVLSLVTRPAVLLRPGTIAVTEIEGIIGLVSGYTRGEAGADPSPGLHAKHYSPRTPLYLLSTPEGGRGVYLSLGARFGEGVETIPMPKTAAGYAAVLYETLHRVDEQGYEWIAVEMPPESAEWAGVVDRLRRAARGRARDGDAVKSA